MADLLSRGYPSTIAAAICQAVYAGDRRAWAEVCGRADVEIPLAEPGPLRVEEPE